jgi:hypothetical protein
VRNPLPAAGSRCRWLSPTGRPDGIPCNGWRRPVPGG